MQFANGLLLAGAALVAVPIILHLIMRQQPKHFMFPALRFLVRRQQANRRRLQFRHWLLLAARCAAVAMLAICLARPSVGPESVGRFIGGMAIVALAALAAIGLGVAYVFQVRRSILIMLAAATAIAAIAGGGFAFRSASKAGDALFAERDAPVAAALAVDVHERMQYRQENQTRLDAAREMGAWILGELPAESDIAVVDSRLDATGLAADLGAAKLRVESLSFASPAASLPRVVLEAIDSIAESKLPRKEVYVLTDRTAAAWNEDDSRRLRRRLAESPEVRLYLIDVGVDAPRNVWLGDLLLPSESTVGGGRLTIEVDVRNLGPATSRSVELRLFDPPQSDALAPSPNERPSTRRQLLADVELPENGAARVRFDVQASGDLARAALEGFVQIVEDDPLAWDNRRYFAVNVRPPDAILVAAPAPADEYAWYLTEPLSPASIGAAARFRFDVIDLATLEKTPLDRLKPYAVVCLVDPTPLTDGAWNVLAEYVGGPSAGSVAFFLGRNAAKVNALPDERFNSPLAGQLLPAKLDLRASDPAGLQLVTERFDHPMLAPLAAVGQSIPWHGLPVYKHWTLGPLDKNARVVVRYSNGDPALVERNVGRGRTATLTTPISDPASGRPWNRLATGENPWPYIALLDGLASYLTGSSEQRYNYFRSQPAVVAVGSSRREVVVTSPLGDRATLPVDPQGRIAFGSTEAIGAYPIEAGGTDDRLRRAFAVNAHADESRLERLTKEQLDERLGEDRYVLARDRADVVRNVGVARVGVDLFGWSILALAALLVVESVMGNFFYRKT
jgi:hypothetical protein